MRRTAGLLAVGAVMLALGTNASGFPGTQPRALSSECSDDSPCRLAAGTYRLSYATVIEGLRFTVPRGWSSTGNNGGELKLVPPGHSNEWLYVFVDLVAVKSTGPGAGKILRGVGHTPAQLVAWATRNRDFTIVSPPRPSSVVRSVRMTTFALGVSKSANFGNPECPDNPRCAALFKDPKYWGDDDFYAIGGTEQVRIYLGTIRLGSKPHSMFVVLDAEGPSHLAGLTAIATPIIQSMRLPGVRSRR